MADNPYSGQKAPIARSGRAARPAKILPPLFSSVIAVTLGFLLLGVQHRAPDFFTSLRFLLPLVGCSAVAALILRPYRGANWLVRAVLAPPIGFALFFLVVVVAHLVAA